MFPIETAGGILHRAAKKGGAFAMIGLGINCIANGIIAAAFAGCATALVISGHTAESFWDWPIYGWLYGIAVLAVLF